MGDSTSEKVIAAGVDGSPTSSAVLEWAAREAVLRGVRLDVVIAWEIPPSYGWALPMPADFSMGEETKKVLAELLVPIHTAHPDLDLRSTVVEGHPVPALIEASRRAELLVVGSHGHGGFVGMLLGSVSTHCVASAHCPVVVVRH